MERTALEQLLSADLQSEPQAEAVYRLLTELAALMVEVATLSAPYHAKIRNLEIAKADATAALIFQIETLQAYLRPLILAEQRSFKVDGCTASYVHKETWDTEGLRRFAEEVPTLLQWVRDASYVSFRHK